MCVLESQFGVAIHVRNQLVQKGTDYSWSLRNAKMRNTSMISEISNKCCKVQLVQQLGKQPPYKGLADTS